MKDTLKYYRFLVLSSLIGCLNFIIPIPSVFFNFNLSGYAWILVFIVSLYYIIFKIKKSFFSYKIWIPLVLYLFIYLIYDFSFIGLQSTLQFTLPLIVGYVAGGLQYNQQVLLKILKYFRNLIIIIILSNSLFSFLRYGILGFGPSAYGPLAVIGGTICLTLFYDTNKKKYLIYYILILTIPTLAATRTAIAIMLLLPFLHTYRIFSNNKIKLLLLFIPLLIYIFNLNVIQEKMFFNGEGNLNEISIDSDNINTSGRKSINFLLINEFYKKPIFGNGLRADYFILKDNFNNIQEAHNDYLQILVNYGLFGLLFLFISYFIQFRYFLSIRIHSRTERLLIITLFSLTLPMMLFMFSENILRMTFSFIIYFYAIAGMLMSINKQNKTILKYNYENNSSHPLI